MLIIDTLKCDKLMNLYVDDPIPVPLNLDFKEELIGITDQGLNISPDSDIMIYSHPKYLAD